MGLEIDKQCCRVRQQRLLEAMQQLGVDLAILTRRESVQWLTGAWVGPLFWPSAGIDSSGHVTIVLPSRKTEMPVAADTVLSYEEKWLSTMRDASEQQASSVAALLDGLGPLPSRAGCEFTAAGKSLHSKASADWQDLDATLFRLRRRK
ncbi:MAG: aminopeptidase P family N-terminal domain-containing protein, partial [Planctomycetota bacterium]